MFTRSLKSPEVITRQLQFPARGTLGDYWKLSKGHLTLWVAISAFPGYLVSLTGPFDPIVATSLFAGTALTSACAQSLNQMWEVERDGKMIRTQKRPLPMQRLSMEQAKSFALLTGVSGASLLSLGTGSVVASGLAVSTALLYAGVYTPMKVQTEYNTHVGAIVGSLPVLIGFAVAGVPLLEASNPWILFTLQTLWQFPHFYALAWLHREDYARGGYRMFPMMDPEGTKTAQMCLPYLAGLSVLPFVSSYLGATSWMFAVTGSVPNFIWVKYGFWPFFQSPSKQSSRVFFLHSLWYLIAMYSAFVFHAKSAESDFRSRMKQKFLAFCPHLHYANDLFTPTVLCPLHKSTDS